MGFLSALLGQNRYVRVLVGRETVLSIRFLQKI